MTDFKRRGNLVNFRLTDEEYEKLKLASSACGAHSLSDFVRGAVLGSVKSSIDGRSPGSDGVSNLEVRISDLQTTIRHLAGLLEEIGGAFAREARRHAFTASASEQEVSSDQIREFR